jgi:hypothetical protein
VLITKISIFLIIAGPPVDKPPIDFSDEIKEDTVVALTWGNRAPTICSLPPG